MPPTDAAADPREQKFCLEDEEKLRAPFEDYHYFREHRPVFFHEGMQGWFVFRHDDVDALFHDPRLSNERMHAFVETVPPSMQAEAEEMLCGPFRRWVLSIDGAEHKTMRRALQHGFSEHEVDALVPLVQGTIDRLIDDAVARGDGRMDVAEELAYPLPIAVISHIVGVPPEDHPRVLRWSDGLADFFNNPPATESSTRRMIDCAHEVMDYVREEVRTLEGAPGDGYIQNLLRPVEGSGLAHDDIASNIVILLLAGHETTRNLIGSAVSLLLSNPEQRALVQADDGLWRNVVEETLRMEPANPLMPRVAAADFEFRGENISKGQLVYLGIGSANRDPEHYPDGDRFDVRREHGKHLAFGSGPHYCMGAVLARREAELALRTLFERFPGLRADDAKPANWMHFAGMRGPRSLPVLLS